MSDFLNAVFDIIGKFLCRIFGIKAEELKDIGLREPEGQGEEDSESELLYRYPFKAKNLFSRREVVLLRILQEFCRNNDLLLLSKVKLLDLVETEDSVPQRERFWQNNRIKELHLDFVLLNEKSLQVFAAIELDDSSHRSEKAQKRDEKKTEALRLAGVQLLRLPPGYFQKEDVFQKLNALTKATV